MAKTYQMEKIRPRTLLLGNSRIENGVDPESPAWPKSYRPVFNAGLAGHDLFLAWRLLQDEMATAPPRTVIVEVDFPDFLISLYPKPESSTANERRLLVRRNGALNKFSWIQRWQDIFAATLSLDALYDSLVTLLDRRPSSSVTMTPYGFNPLHEYSLEIRNIGHYGLFRQKMAEYKRRFSRYPHRNFFRPRQSVEFEYLDHIIDSAYCARSRVVFFIPPYHAQLLNSIRTSGLLASFQSWKAAMAGMVNRKMQSLPGLDIRLIDFSDYGPYTTERVPSAGDHHSKMRWYWEPGHFKSALGDKIVQRIVGSARDETFGVEINLGGKKLKRLQPSFSCRRNAAIADPYIVDGWPSG